MIFKFKKRVSFIFAILLIFTSASSVFATDKILYQAKIDGELYIVKELVNNKTERIITVETKDVITKSILNKKYNTVSIYKTTPILSSFKELDGKSNTYGVNELVAKVRLKSDRELSSLSMLRSSYNYDYRSEYYEDYMFGYYAAAGMWKFNLEIPTDSLTTSYVSSSDSVYRDSYDFKNRLKSADSHTESAMLTGLGFIPGIGAAFGIASVIDSLSDGNMTTSEFNAALLAGVELVPGVGTIIAIADFCANASLAAADLFIVRQEFRSVKRAI